MIISKEIMQKWENPSLLALARAPGGNGFGADRDLSSDGSKAAPYADLRSGFHSAA